MEKNFSSGHFNKLLDRAMASSAILSLTIAHDLFQEIVVSYFLGVIRGNVTNQL